MINNIKILVLGVAIFGLMCSFNLLKAEEALWCISIFNFIYGVLLPKIFDDRG